MNHSPKRYRLEMRCGPQALARVWKKHEQEDEKEIFNLCKPHGRGAFLLPDVDLEQARLASNLLRSEHFIGRSSCGVCVLKWKRFFVFKACFDCLEFRDGI